MSVPNFEFTPPVIAGNPHDDDAEILDNLVESKAEPPTPAQEPTARVNPLDKAPVITRTITETINVDPAWGPVQLLPSDANRRALHITAASDTATDYVLIADDKGRLASSFAGFALAAGGFVDLNAHTGSVWVVPNAANTSVVTVSVVAVTL